MTDYEIEFKKDIFNEVYYPFLDDQTRTQIFFGGASAGKSIFAIGQRVIYDLLNGGRNYLCCRNTAKTIRGSIFNELNKSITKYGLSALFKSNKSDKIITCVNGYQALTTGLDDVEKVKSITPEKGIITDILVEEATETVEDDVDQLEIRLRGESGGLKKRVTLLFNPILKSHWIYKKYFNNWINGKNLYRDKNLVILKTTYNDNAFLEPDDIERLEGIEDEYKRQVYTLGNWGVLGGVIFTNWRVEDILNNPIYKTFDIFRNGLDFGFVHPTAFNRMYYHRDTKKLYIFKEWHGKGVLINGVAKAIQPIIGSENVICDSARPDCIAELNDYGISAIGAIKGKDSILHGIQWLQQQEIIIDRTCQYTKNEFEQYHWKKDRFGETMQEPLDKDNHHIDNIRYAMEEYSLGGGDLDFGLGQEMESAVGM